MKSIFIFLLFFIFQIFSIFGNIEKFILRDKIIFLDTQKCILILDKKYFKLDLKKNCFFLKEYNSTKVRSEYYNDIKSYVLIIVGNSVKNSDEFPITKTRHDCGKKIQGITFSDKGSINLKKVWDVRLECPEHGMDEKIFWMFGHWD